jgi:hypothetical protein
VHQKRATTAGSAQSIVIVHFVVMPASLEVGTDRKLSPRACTTRRFHCSDS